MPGNTASIILKAKSGEIRKGTDDLRKMERQAGRTERTTDKLARSFKRMGKVAAVAAVAVAGLFAGRVLKNTIAQEQAVAQLNASLESTGRFTEEASEALQAHAAALQQTSTFGDEAIITTQSLLLTFKALGGDVLPRTTEAVLDMSVKMGTDLKSSAIQLGKALNDPITGLSALSRVGVTFSESQKEVIKQLVKTNQLAKAQSLILDELETEFGGSAKAARETLGGALSLLSNNFNDLLEGKSGSKGVKGVTAAINDLAAVLADPEVKQGFQDLTVGVLQLVGAMAKIPAAFFNAKRSIKSFFDIVDEDSSLEELEAKLERLRSGGESVFDLLFVSRNTTIQQLRDFAGRGGELERLIADIQFPEIQVGTSRLDPAGRVAAAVSAVDPGPTGPTEKEIRDAQKAREKALENAARASDELRQSLRRLAEETGGPTVEANHRLEDALQAVQEQEDALRAVGKLSEEQQHLLTEAREGAILSHQRQIELLKAEAEERASILTPAEEMIASLELEIKLQGMSNLERAKTIALLQAETDATTTNGQKIIDLMDRAAANDDAIRAMDAFRDVSVNLLTDLADESVSAKDALGSFFDSLRTRLLRMIAENLIEKAFGSFGSLGGGSAGGGIVGFFSSLFGAGKAHGGNVSPGKLHPVTEQGPELFNVAGKQFLLPDNRGGNVVPIRENTSTSNVTNNFNFPPTIQRRSAQQTANEISRVQKRATARNR